MTLGGKAFEVVGIAETPLGGQSSDVYVKLSQLQALSDREGRVNTVYVRAESADDVAAVATQIEKTVDGASVTTAEDLADRVSGTLSDAKNLAGSLGTALSIVGLLAAFLIATLLTLSSVTKRIRELGTLKALGWSQWLVVRQVTGESVTQGLLGGAVGVVLGVGGALLVGRVRPFARGDGRLRGIRGPAALRPVRAGRGRDRRPRRSRSALPSASPSSSAAVGSRASRWARRGSGRKHASRTASSRRRTSAHRLMPTPVYDLRSVSKTYWLGRECRPRGA